MEAMSFISFNIIQNIRDKYSWFQGDFYVVMKSIVGVSPCHHIVTHSNNTCYCLKCLYCEQSVDHGDSANNGDSANHGGNAHLGGNANRADSG